jgi:hypothetical protein
MWGMVKGGTEAFTLFILIIIPSVLPTHPWSRPGITGIFKALVSRDSVSPSSYNWKRINEWSVWILKWPIRRSYEMLITELSETETIIIRLREVCGRKQNFYIKGEPYWRVALIKIKWLGSNEYFLVRFELSTAVTMMIIVFWEMTRWGRWGSNKSHTASSPRRR